MLCDQEDESYNHLLLSCVFTREVWARLLDSVGLLRLAPTHDDTLSDWWLRSRLELPTSLRRAFDSTVLLVSWAMWKERNGRTFDRSSRTTSQLLTVIIDDLRSHAAAGFRCLSALVAAMH